MGRTMLSILFVAFLCAGIAPPAVAADELFDTAAAAEHTGKGMEHLRARQYDSAIKEFEESTLIFPGAEAYYYLGYAYYLKGKTGDGESRKKAMENFDRAYALNPNFTPNQLTGEVMPTQPAEAPRADEGDSETEEPGQRVFMGTAQPEQPQPAQPAAPPQPTPPVPPTTPPITEPVPPQPPQ